MYSQFGYVLKANDYKKIASSRFSRNGVPFFIGISAEGLLALGTVRACSGDDIPKSIVMNEEKIDLELYKSQDGRVFGRFILFVHQHD